MKTTKTFFGKDVEYDKIVIKDTEYKLSFWTKLLFLFSRTNIYAISKIYLKDSNAVSIVPTLFIGSRQEAKEHSSKLLKNEK